jgi:hypothetical protein
VALDSDVGRHGAETIDRWKSGNKNIDALIVFALRENLFKKRCLK